MDPKSLLELESVTKDTFTGANPMWIESVGICHGLADTVGLMPKQSIRARMLFRKNLFIKDKV